MEGPKSFLVEPIQNSSNYYPFVMGLLYFVLVGVIYSLSWYFFSLQSSLLIGSPLMLAVGVTIATTSYFIFSWTYDNDKFKSRMKSIGEMLKLHYENHKDQILKYLAIFACTVFVIGLVSLLLKEILQNSSGHLIPLKYLSMPILFSAVTFILIFTLYLAIKPMKDAIDITDAENNTHVGNIFYFGSFMVKIGTWIGASIAVGLCYYTFYADFINKFSIFSLSTSSSIVLLCSIVGLFVATFSYIRSKNNKSDALSFRQFFYDIFKFNNQNSFRRLFSTSKILVKNSAWAIIFTAICFTTLYYLPVSVLPNLSAVIFINTLKSILLISISAQGILSLFEAACASYDYDDHLIVHYKMNNIKQTDELKDEEQTSLVNRIGSNDDIELSDTTELRA